MKDPYVYKDSDVLINKADIKEKNKLDEFENRMSNLALVMLFKSDVKIENANDIFKIHKMLFENVYQWADIWRVHPFREGNTRTISVFAFLLLKQYGYLFNAELIKENAKYFRNALVMASLKEYAEYQYLQKIVVDSISDEAITSSANKYKKIKDYNVEDYKYVYHKVK